MSSALYSRLAWLPPAPTDFAQQCRQLAECSSGAGARAQWLANHALDDTQLNRLAKALGKLRQGGITLAPLLPFRLGILGNATIDLLLPALTASAARHGIALECVKADYAQTLQAALMADSPINRAQCDAVLLAVDHRGLPLLDSAGDAATAGQTVKAALDFVQTLRAGLRSHHKTICLLQTLPRPSESAFGHLDLVLPGTQRQLIDAFNRGLADSVADTEDLLLDVAHIAETVGLAEWHDTTLWNMAKLPFSGLFLPLYADHVCRLIAALRGRSRKCLILDLDNTLWGGVIGDDGLEGIVIGQGDATGEAHLQVQRTALDLRARGVVLAVSSKNTDAVARLPFQKHPEMALREEHIAVFQANWNDKATNIQAIANELALGLDAMVFLDDNPMERDLVRQVLPQVAVPELPADPALYARTLMAAGYFESIAFSEEDRKRAAFYQDNARRVQLQKQAGDIDGYLQSLDMTMTLAPFDDTGRARIAQLINKSNQFNLTTHRYTEAQVAALQADPQVFSLQVRLADRFGDNGMISVIICRRVGLDWDIDTWLMSCRVLGRKVENAILQELLRAASARGIQRLLGTYLPTEKNALVEEHYAKLGFTLLERDAARVSRWMLEVGAVPQLELPMAIERSALAAAGAA
ncbi:MAG: HAD-IIIC family phosphatase [Steroidobacteraceae bacterium]